MIESGPATGPLAVVGWGSTFGAIHSAVMHRGDDATPVSHVHLRHLWPLPSNLGELLAGFDHVLVPEMNTGQLAWLIRARTLREVISYTKIQGKPFYRTEIEKKIHEILGA